jgi:hypothetical protein
MRLWVHVPWLSFFILSRLYLRSSHDIPKPSFSAVLSLAYSIVVVTIGCKEPPGAFHPPTDRYSIIQLRCDPATNDRDGHEAGPMIRFFGDYWGRFRRTKLIFAHAHDRSYHYPGGTIWDYIDRLVQTEYFRTHEFGNVIGGGSFLGVAFRKSGNTTWAQMDSDTWWMNMTDYALFLFRNTSFMGVPWTEWHMPCCSTFFMDSELIMRHPQWEYRILMERIRTMVSVGYCNLFNRSACRDYGEKIIIPTQAHFSFIVGGVLERAWGPMFTGKSNQEWNYTNAM